MDAYRKQIRGRIVILVVCAACALVFVGTAGVWGYLMSQGSQQHVRDFGNGISAGVFCAMAAVMVLNISRYRAALNDENKLRQLYIQEHDERAQLIFFRTGGWAYTAALGALIVAGIAINFVDDKVGFTLMMAAVFMAFLRLGLKLYYNKKF